MYPAAPASTSLDRERARAIVARVSHWHHKFEVFPGVVTPGSYDPGFLLEKLQLPKDMAGLKVLDIGPSDGFFSMNMARRGARVTVVDYRAKNVHGFGAMEQLTALEFDYRQMNLYDIPGSDIGTFDIVLFLGVLYHLPDMVRALNIVAGLCQGRLLIETEFAPALMPGVAAAQYYEAASLAGDITNFWVPNRDCLFAMVRDIGFRINRSDSWDTRILVDASPGGTAKTEKMAYAYGLLPG
ncbi:methyltransferase domain-containing protein [Mesorhizobium sp. M1406]|uniref:class I SAM-dependent methyltransferase n=1 Tax=Mesorhizobium sp. M1406 TaxID=2957099 RepID=UPI0033350FF5